MAQDSPQVLATLKPEPKAPARLLKGDQVLPPQTEVLVVPEGAVILLPGGDWTDKTGALLVLKGEGNRALTKAVSGTHGDPAGASARERSVKDIYEMLKRDDLKGISRKLFGHTNAKWFRLADITHPEVRRVNADGEPARAEVDWDHEE
jgi:hypothetical protein